MSATEREQWGVLVRGSVRPLPVARNVTDATLYAAHLNTTQRVKAIVVYRYSDSELWRRWIDNQPVPTQLVLFSSEVQR
ncbi:hypothetical protein [Nocardia blacklockiae]|uniref:hypothetical protein n=1 Tax=Nocardia blacklockiae TaxID=480036 RepID=UPI0018945971|nr:hypothetical protein [Nocardia blacklockiae]MBF6174291.1 hypothetical protein [Nocardia blacklockiae]